MGVQMKTTNIHRPCFYSKRDFEKVGFTCLEGRKMKKLLIVCAVLLLFGAGYAMAQPNYQVDTAGDPDKDYITETTIPPGQQISFDIYLADAVAPQYAGGVWIDFSDSTNFISYVTAGRALMDGSEAVTGPWDPAGGVIVNEPAGPGTLLLTAINLATAIPDEEGDIIVGRVTLQCTSSGDANIAITTIPGVPTWTPIDDSIVVSGSVVIHQVCECLNDEDCHDGLWCNGSETCSDCVCLPGVPLHCDDGTECSVDPCREADPICGIIDCEEIVGTCTAQYCNTSVITGSTNSCLADPICAGVFSDDWDADGVDNSTDNCGGIYNPDQADGDGDGVGDICDNCPSDDNPDQRDDDSDGWGSICDPEDDSDGILAPPDNCPNTSNPDQTNSDTDSYGDACDNCPDTPNPNQEDQYPPGGNSIGDACDCECDFDCSGGVDAIDVTAFLGHFGRSTFNNPCTYDTQCNGDSNCDGNVDALDVNKFLEDFGRSQFNNPCPPCEAGDWCDGGNICQNNDDCSFFYTFCGKPTGQCDGEGICYPIPSSCPFMPNPVCGCDGNTYINSCTARWWRQSIDYWGACGE